MTRIRLSFGTAILVLLFGSCANHSVDFIEKKPNYNIGGCSCISKNPSVSNFLFLNKDIMFFDERLVELSIKDTIILFPRYYYSAHFNTDTTFSYVEHQALRRTDTLELKLYSIDSLFIMSQLRGGVTCYKLPKKNQIKIKGLTLVSNGLKYHSRWDLDSNLYFSFTEVLDGKKYSTKGKMNSNFWEGVNDIINLIDIEQMKSSNPYLFHDDVNVNIDLEYDLNGKKGHITKEVGIRALNSKPLEGLLAFLFQVQLLQTRAR